MMLRAVIVWLFIALAEVLNGMARMRLLNRRVGDRRARQIGVFTGSALIVMIAWCSGPWIGAQSTGELLGVGGIWLGLMLAFDIGLGRLVFRVSWERIGADFNVRRGGLLGIGMAILFVAPLLVAYLRGRM